MGSLGNVSGGGGQQIPKGLSVQLVGSVPSSRISLLFCWFCPRICAVGNAGLEYVECSICGRCVLLNMTAPPLPFPFFPAPNIPANVENSLLLQRHHILLLALS
jgi:hypothetical protein